MHFARMLCSAYKSVLSLSTKLKVVFLFENSKCQIIATDAGRFVHWA